MRILIDARYLDGTYTGIGTYSRNLLHNLSRLDSENEYYVLVRPGQKDTMGLGPNFRIITYRPRPVSFSTLLFLGRYVDSLKVDLMHSLFPLAPLFMRTPLMVTVHDLQPFIDPEFSARRPLWIQVLYKFFYRYAYPAVMHRCKWIINVSYHTRDMVAEFFPAEIPKLTVVTSGLDASHFDLPEKDPAEVCERHELNRPFLLYYGSTRPNKNLSNIVRAFAHYARESGDNETELVFILKRDRFFREVKKVMKREEIGDRIRVLDQVSHDDQRAILSRARAFVFPTRYEGFGFPALEAMAAGIPVIASNSGALPEICEDAALVVSPEDPEEIAVAMDSLLHDEALRAKLREKGFEQARRFDWEQAARSVRDIYNLLF